MRPMTTRPIEKPKYIQGTVLVEPLLYAVPTAPMVMPEPTIVATMVPIKASLPKRLPPRIKSSMVWILPFAMKPMPNIPTR